MTQPPSQKSRPGPTKASQAYLATVRSQPACQLSAQSIQLTLTLQLFAVGAQGRVGTRVRMESGEAVAWGSVTKTVAQLTIGGHLVADADDVVQPLGWSQLQRKLYSLPSSSERGKDAGVSCTSSASELTVLHVPQPVMPVDFCQLRRRCMLTGWIEVAKPERIRVSWRRELGHRQPTCRQLHRLRDSSPVASAARGLNPICSHEARMIRLDAERGRRSPAGTGRWGPAGALGERCRPSHRKGCWY